MFVHVIPAKNLFPTYENLYALKTKISKNQNRKQNNYIGIDFHMIYVLIIEFICFICLQNIQI